MSSALSLKLRTGQITIGQRAAALKRFQKTSSDSLVVASVERHHHWEAARLADRHELGLRAGGALHVSIGMSRGDAIWTLDRGMTEAGAQIGAEIELLA